MRVIDMANAWASGTHTQYQSKLSSIRSFELFHDFPILQRSSLSCPPDSIDIPLMWIQESYSLHPSSRANDSLVSFATVRSLRSAASQFLGWEMMMSSPLSTFIDQQQCVLHQPRRATDSYSYTLFTKGISGRLGTDSQPATALLFRHVFFMDSCFLANYCASTTDVSRRRWALAGLANALFGWVGSDQVKFSTLRIMMLMSFFHVTAQPTTYPQTSEWYCVGSSLKRRPIERLLLTLLWHILRFPASPLDLGAAELPVRSLACPLGPHITLALFSSKMMGPDVHPITFVRLLFTRVSNNYNSSVSPMAGADWV
jgi:hypothetical protein